MKKTLILLCLISLLHNLRAQSFQVLDAGNTDVSGDTLNFFTSPGIMITKSLDVKNISNSTKSIRCKRRLISGVLSTDSVRFEWGNICFVYSNNPISTTLQNPIGAGMVFDQLNSMGLKSYFSASNFSGARIVSYTFYDNANTTDSVTVFLKYNIGAVGYNEINKPLFSISQPMPNPAANESAIHYHFSQTYQSASIQLLNLNGAIIKEFKLEELKGKIIINTGELAGGLYFCNLMVDNKAIETKKLVITH